MVVVDFGCKKEKPGVGVNLVALRTCRFDSLFVDRVLVRWLDNCQSFKCASKIVLRGAGEGGGELGVDLRNDI